MNTDTFNEMTEEIKADEGVVNEVYLDHLGLPTVGVGHLIREDDPEHGLAVGTKIDDERVTELFEADLYTCVAETKLLYPQFEELPAEAQKILCNMMFNLGRPRLPSSLRCVNMSIMVLGQMLLMKCWTLNGQNKYQIEQIVLLNV